MSGIRHNGYPRVLKCEQCPLTGKRSSIGCENGHAKERSSKREILRINLNSIMRRHCRRGAIVMAVPISKLDLQVLDIVALLTIVWNRATL
jgi:hypothetical protein